MTPDPQGAQPNADEVEAACVAYEEPDAGWTPFSALGEQQMGECRRLMHAALTAAYACPSGTLAGVVAERDAYKRALEEIAEDVGILSNEFVRNTARAALAPSGEDERA